MVLYRLGKCSRSLRVNTLVAIFQLPNFLFYCKIDVLHFNLKPTSLVVTTCKLKCLFGVFLKVLHRYQFSIVFINRFIAL